MHAMSQRSCAQRAYVGRFAPSPSGPLHAGSLLAAVASFLDARANQGKWLLRIEDVDELRTVEGAEAEIQWALEAHGLHWDEKVPMQSSASRQLRYQDCLELLCDKGLIFDCNCTRKQLRAVSGPYPGTCRDKLSTRQSLKTSKGYQALRFNTSLGEANFAYHDLIQGEQHGELETYGDFIVCRRDGLFAYQLAMVVDDFDQGVSHVLRGTDIMASTPWQLALQGALDFRPPEYAHFPVLTKSGDKLSKQTGAKAVLPTLRSNAHQSRAESIAWQSKQNLLNALEQLGQPLPGDSAEMNCEQVLTEATNHWRLQNVLKQAQLPL